MERQPQTATPARRAGARRGRSAGCAARRPRGNESSGRGSIRGRSLAEFTRRDCRAAAARQLGEAPRRDIRRAKRRAVARLHGESQCLVFARGGCARGGETAAWRDGRRRAAAARRDGRKARWPRGLRRLSRLRTAASAPFKSMRRLFGRFEIVSSASDRAAAEGKGD